MSIVRRVGQLVDCEALRNYNATAPWRKTFENGVFRFVVEFLRVSTAEGLFHIGHLWAVLSGIIGLIVLLIRRKSLPFAKRSVGDE